MEEKVSQDPEETVLDDEEALPASMMRVISLLSTCIVAVLYGSLQYYVHLNHIAFVVFAVFAGFLGASVGIAHQQEEPAPSLFFAGVWGAICGIIFIYLQWVCHFSWDGGGLDVLIPTDLWVAIEEEANRMDIPTWTSEDSDVEGPPPKLLRSIIWSLESGLSLLWCIGMSISAAMADTEIEDPDGEP